YKLSRLVGLALGWEGGKACYLPLAHDMLGSGEQLSVEEALSALQPLLEDQGVFKAGHDLKLASHLLRNHGIRLRGRRFDTMLQSYVLNSVAHRHTLERLCQQYLDLELPAP